MKRTFTLILAMLLLASAASCGESGTTADTTASGGEAETTAAPEKSPYEELEARNFGGKTFTLFDSNSYPEKHINIPGEEMNGDIVNDALFKRDSDIETRFHVTIDYVQEKGLDTFKNSVLAGDDEYQLLISKCLWSGIEALATQGLMQDLCGSEHLTLDAAWWSPLLYEQLRFNDCMYFSTGDISPTLYGSACCLFLNLDLMEEHKIDTDIFGTVMDGKWTVDAMYNIIKDFDTDLNADGEMNTSDDLYGFITTANLETADMWLAAMGLELAAVNEDSTAMTCANLSDGKLIDSIESIMRFVKPLKYETNLVPVFSSGRALFAQHKTEFTIMIREEMEDDYLILPIPKRDEAQESYITLASGNNTAFCGIPVTADMDFAGFITEAMARYSREYIRPLAYNVVYEDKLSRDERTKDILDILFDTSYINFHLVYNFGGMDGAVRDVLFNGKPLASTMASLQSSAEAAIADFCDTWGKQ